MRDERGILERWEDLVVRYSVHGKPTHDARIVAAMLKHEVTHLLTYNVTEFSRFTEINCVSPDNFIADEV